MKKSILFLLTFLCYSSWVYAVIIRQSVVDGDKYLKIRDAVSVALVDKKDATHFVMKSFDFLESCGEKNKPQIIFVSPKDPEYRSAAGQNLYLGCDKNGVLKVFSLQSCLPALLRSENGENILWTIYGFDALGTFISIDKTRLVVEHAYLCDNSEDECDG